MHLYVPTSRIVASKNPRDGRANRSETADVCNVASVFRETRANPEHARIHGTHVELFANSQISAFWQARMPALVIDSSRFCFPERR